MKEKFEETLEKFYEVGREVRKDCTDFLKEVLDKLPNKSINLDVEDNYVTVSYDGGRHPEFASNVFSSVLSVYLKDDKVYLDTDDCDGYSIDNITNGELGDVTLAVKYEIANNNDIEED